MEASEKHSYWAFTGETEAHQQRKRIESFTILYFLLQALILCSITGSLHVSVHRWIAAVLSLTLSVLHFSYLVEASGLARMEMGRARGCLEAHRVIRARFVPDGPADPVEVSSYWSVKRRVVSGVVGALLVVYAAVMVVGCLVISPETKGLEKSNFMNQ